MSQTLATQSATPGSASGPNPENLMTRRYMRWVLDNDGQVHRLVTECTVDYPQVNSQEGQKSLLSDVQEYLELRAQERRQATDVDVDSWSLKLENDPSKLEANEKWVLDRTLLTEALCRTHGTQGALNHFLQIQHTMGFGPIDSFNRSSAGAGEHSGHGHPQGSALKLPTQNGEARDLAKGHSDGDTFYYSGTRSLTSPDSGSCTVVKHKFAVDPSLVNYDSQMKRLKHVQETYKAVHTAHTGSLIAALRRGLSQLSRAHQARSPQCTTSGIVDWMTRYVTDEEARSLHSSNVSASGERTTPGRKLTWTSAATLAGRFTFTPGRVPSQGGNAFEASAPAAETMSPTVQPGDKRGPALSADGETTIKQEE